MRKHELSCQIVLSCLLIALAGVTHAAGKKHGEKEFIFDRYGSSHSSSSILISSRALLNEAEDCVFRTKHASYSIGGRIATTVLNNVLNFFLAVVNHEVHGHGFRARSLGIPVSHYSFEFLGLGGATHFQPHCFALVDERLLLTIGGSEANNVLAQQLLFKSFQKLSLDSRTYILFLGTYLDLPYYVLSTYFSETVHNDLDNDIVCYLEEINAKHNTDGVDIDKLMKASLVFLCNPILYVSLWAQLDYLFTGKGTFAIPHLKLAYINYMPLVRMGLTPFGPIHYLENYIGHGNKTFLVSISGGQSPYYTRGYGGIRLQTARLWTYKNCGLDVTGALWYQPKMQLQANDQIEDKNYWGGLVGIDNKLKLGDLISLNASILYKNVGFVEGVVANSGFIARAGFSLHY